MPALYTHIKREWSPSLNDYHYMLYTKGQTYTRSGSRQWAEFMADKLGIEIEED